MRAIFSMWTRCLLGSALGIVSLVQGIDLQQQDLIAFDLEQDSSESSFERIGQRLESWLAITSTSNDNQTPVLNKVLSGSELPFKIKIELSDFPALGSGLHSNAFGTSNDLWLLIAGRTNGLHGFNNTDNFPPSQQNTVVYVVDSTNKTIASRDLLDAGSGLTQTQVDWLSVTSPQFYQSGQTLYITGGYGIDTGSGLFSTKDVLTAIDIPGLIHWVTDPSVDETAAQHIRHIQDPIFQITGGYMSQIGSHPTLLVFGQNFIGEYTDSANGIYSEQVRRFRIIDDGSYLAIAKLSPLPTTRNSNYRRRDLNVVPTVTLKGIHKKYGLIALAGVFTEDVGVWTIPVEINSHGSAQMTPAYKKSAFKQAMNHYVCPTFGLFSERSEKMYMVIPGGLSYGFFQDGVFETDAEIPFLNQVTTVSRNRHGHYKQYLMNNEYPVILSTQSNPGNQLLFGAGAAFIPTNNLESYQNGVFDFDKLGKYKTVVGYIVGGIQSTLPNTNTMSDSAASPYIFKVSVTRQ